MKRIILSLLVIMNTFSLINAQELDQKFLHFKDFYFECRDAYQKRSADSLAECVMVLDSMHRATSDSWTTWKKLKPKSVQDSSLYNNHLIIDINILDSLVEEWSQNAIPIDISSKLRGNKLKYANYLIPANSTESFTSAGFGRMSIMVISEDGTDIQIKVDQESCDHHYVSEGKSQSDCQFDVWQAKPFPNSTPYEIQVTNPSDHDIVCVFVSD